MYTLIEQCVAGINDAWTELMATYHRDVHHRVRRLLARAGFTAEDADDFASELFHHLSEHDCRRLQTFEGTTELQFNTWLRDVAKHYALDWIDKQFRRIKHEKDAIRNYPIEDHNGPTESEVRLVIEDCKGILSPEELDRVSASIRPPDAVVEGESSPPDHESTVPPRTRRLRKKNLEERFRRALGCTRGTVQSPQKDEPKKIDH